MSDPARLDGRVAIVTGGARGIGRGIALVLARAGASVLVGDLLDASETVAEAEALGARAAAVRMDVSDPGQADALAARAVEELGGLDVLVNNAAIDAPPGQALELSDEDWRRTLAVNLDGSFYMARASARRMVAAGGGSIVNLGSHFAWSPTEEVSPAYSAGKAAILGLTMSLSAQLAPRGVRVNAVAPALVASRDFGWTPEVEARRLAEYPLGAGTPEDIGEAVRHLASPAARWTTGTVLYIHGGHRKSGPWV